MQSFLKFLFIFNWRIIALQYHAFIFKSGILSKNNLPSWTLYKCKKLMKEKEEKNILDSYLSDFTVWATREALFTQF